MLIDYDKYKQNVVQPCPNGVSMAKPSLLI